MDFRRPLGWGLPRFRSCLSPLLVACAPVRGLRSSRPRSPPFRPHFPSFQACWSPASQSVRPITGRSVDDLVALDYDLRGRQIGHREVDYDPRHFTPAQHDCIISGTGVTSISRRGRPTTMALNVGAVNEPVILFGILAARIEIGDGSSLASSMSIYHRARVLPAGK